MKKTFIHLSILLFALTSCKNEDLINNSTLFTPVTHTISLSENYIDGSTPKYSNIMPGDIVIIEPGKREYLKFQNFKGSESQYITFTNGAGQVLIENDLSYGIAFENCQFFRFLGNGESSIDYGIKIGRTGASASGLGLSKLSSDFEIAYIEIANTGFAGIMSKSDPVADGTANRGNFTQRNTVFHDNYIHETKGEGFYLGYSRFFEYKGYLAHEIHGIKVYNNLVIDTGLDGIQVGCATQNCEIYNNTIIGSGKSKEFGQMSGIQVGGGTTGKVYNNLIKDGSGIGIFLQGYGDNEVYNNTIVNAGWNYAPTTIENSAIYGIFCTDDETTRENSFYKIRDNLIISPKTDGIRSYSKKTKQEFTDNSIINPGAIQVYENDNTSRTRADAFIFLGNSSVKSQSTLSGNKFISY